MSRRNTTIYIVLLIVALALFFVPWRTVNYSGTLIATQTGMQAIRGTVRLAASAEDAGLGLSGDQSVVSLRDLYEDLGVSELHEGEDVDTLYLGRSFNAMPGLGIAALCLLIGAVGSAVTRVMRTRHRTALVPGAIALLAFFPLWPMWYFPIEDALNLNLVIKAAMSNDDPATTGVDTTLWYRAVSAVVVVSAAWFLANAAFLVRAMATATEAEAEAEADG